MNNETNKPTYYSVIPARVKYDEHLSMFSRILYGELGSLSSKHGYCFSTNGYFAKIFGISERTVTRALTELEKHGHITFKNRNGVDGVREIHLAPEIPVGDSAVVSTIDKNVEHNNINSNNINISISKDIDTKKEIATPVDGLNKLTRVTKVYSLLWRHKYGRSPANFDFGRLGKKLKPILDSYTDYQLALLLIQYFEWRGDTCSDDFLYKRLSSNTFPLLWFPDYADSIAVFTQNTMGIDIDNEGVVKKVVDDHLRLINT